MLEEQNFHDVKINIIKFFEVNENDEGVKDHKEIKNQNGFFDQKQNELAQTTVVTQNNDQSTGPQNAINTDLI